MSHREHMQYGITRWEILTVSADYLKRIVAWAILAICCALPLSSGLGGEALASSKALLTNAVQVITLGIEEAGLGLPVKVRGVVTFIDREWHYAIIQDATSGICVKLDHITNAYSASQVLEIEGVSNPGDFSPVILPHRIEVVGIADLPTPEKTYLPEISRGQKDCQWVEIQGIVQSAFYDREYLIMQVAASAGIFSARLFIKDPTLVPDNLVDAEVRLRGAVGAIFNQQRQILGVRILIPRLEDLIIEKPAPATRKHLAVQSVGNFMRFDPKGHMQHRVRLRGVVTYHRPGAGLFLQDGTNALFVSSTQSNRLKAGDWIDVAGFPGFAEGKPALVSADYQVLFAGQEPQPLRTTIAELRRGALDNRLVEVEAKVMQDWMRTDEEWMAVLQAGEVVFTAQWDSAVAGEAFPALTPGSVVRLAGIAWNKYNADLRVEGVTLLPRSAADVRVVHRAPWWGSKHAAVTVGILAVFMVGTLIWGATLRREIGQRRKTEQQLRESEALYISLVQHMPLCVIRKDHEGKIVFVNQQFERVTGKPLSVVLGKTEAHFFPPELAKKYMSEDAEVMAKGTVYEAIEHQSLPDGGERFLQFWKTPVQDAQGKTLGVQTMFWEVTERERAKRELAYERELFQILLDTIPDCIYFKDLQSRFVRASRVFSERFGLGDAEQMQGKTDFDFFTPEHAQPAYEDEQNIIRTGQPMIGKLERETYDGGRVTWALSTKMPWRNKEGRIIGIVGISKNVTELKQAEERIEQIHRQLMDTSRRAGMAEVATGVLHNVGNVLNSVNVSANLVAQRVRNLRVGSVSQVGKMLLEHLNDLGVFLTQDGRGKEIPQYLSLLGEHLAGEQKTLLQEVQSLVQNVEHINEIVAMQQNYAKVAGVIEQVSLTDLIEDALRMNSGAYLRHQIAIKQEFSSLPLVRVDRHRLLEILINLLSNAKYACSASGRKDRCITVQAAPSPQGGVRIVVADNGVGIAAENLTKIFSHGFTTRKHGHGFGLHTSALAARAMGGALTVASDGPGCGAAFTLELPLEPPAAKLEETATDTDEVARAV